MSDGFDEFSSAISVSIRCGLLVNFVEFLSHNTYTNYFRLIIPYHRGCWCSVVASVISRGLLAAIQDF